MTPTIDYLGKSTPMNSMIKDQRRLLQPIDKSPTLKGFLRGLQNARFFAILRLVKMLNFCLERRIKQIASGSYRPYSRALLTRSLLFAIKTLEIFTNGRQK